jgi:hypothetical protein
MPARVSAEMLRALELIKGGATPYRAAKETGLHESTISRSRLYRAWLAEQGEKKKAV